MLNLYTGNNLNKIIALVLFFLNVGSVTAANNAVVVPSDLLLKSSFESRARGVILLIADDMGIVSNNAYSDIFNSSSYADTQVMDKVCSTGVRFTNVWSNPMCTPTRSTLLTGRYGFRTNMGGAITNNQTNLQAGIQDQEAQWSLPILLKQFGPEGLKLANIGKWHLGEENDGPCQPIKFGWQQYAGKLNGAQPADYEDWHYYTSQEPLMPNGDCTTTETPNKQDYVTVANIDDAIQFVNDANGAPFFLWLAYNAPHAPWQIPPPLFDGSAPMWSEPVGYPENYQDWYDFDRDSTLQAVDCTPLNPLQDGCPTNLWYEAMLSNSDYEFDKLMQALGANSGEIPDDIMVIVIGDNGSDNRSFPATVDGVDISSIQSKQTVYQHGVRVPFCIAGAGVENQGDVHENVNLVDIYATVLESFGVNEPIWKSHVSQIAPSIIHDSVSVFPYLAGNRAADIRPTIFTEMFNFPGVDKAAAISDGIYKYIRFDNTIPKVPECYKIDDPANNPVETLNVLADTNPNNDGSCQQLRQDMVTLVCTESNTPNFTWSNWCE